MRLIHFSKLFWPAAILSTILCLSGVVGYIVLGFNLGVDFQAGLIQEIQFAPSAMEITYNGQAKASITISKTDITIAVSGNGEQETQQIYSLATYPTLDALKTAMTSGDTAIPGINIKLSAPGTTNSAWLVQSAVGNPQLGADAFVLHYLAPDAKPIAIQDVRNCLTPLGTVSVQVVGAPNERSFQVRLQASNTPKSGEESQAEQAATADKVLNTLEAKFGQDQVAVASSNFVGQSYSKNLITKTMWLMLATIILIWVYVSFRFKPQFALGAVLAIIHDALIMTAFMVWTRMEFNTTSIAAILTILGYSINDTIVIYDRVREELRMFPDQPFVYVINKAISDCLSRTLITTLTTMLAVFSLFFFTTGDMHRFAAALLVGMVSGCYSTIYIAGGFSNFWNTVKEHREKKHQALAKEDTKAGKAVKHTSAKPAPATA
jgi:preprotein translocase subunit SecF